MSPKISRQLWVWLVAFTASSCQQPTLENTGLPPNVRDLAKEDGDPSSLDLQAKWQGLAESLGIPANEAATESELRTQLATPSKLLADPDGLAKLIGNVSAKFASSAFKTRCGEIASLSLLSVAKQLDATTGAVVDLDTAKVYLMQYKLLSSVTGDKEALARSGLVVIPEAGSANAPLLAYGHGGDFGLGYSEIAGTFGALQGNHIILAPTFPGEPLCKNAIEPLKGSCDESGVLIEAGALGSPYDEDVDELLGMYDCLVRAAINSLDVNIKDENGADSGTTLTAKISPLVKRHGGGDLAQLPQGILVGFSRGAMVAGLALAKTGAALGALASGAQNPLGAAYGLPSYFSCSALLAPPVAYTMGKLRLFLEQWVKGNLAYTPFRQFPGVRNLTDLFAAYISGDETLEVATLNVAQRDLILSGPLLVGALRNWALFTTGTKNGGPGALLFMHGTLDQVVPFTQTQAGYNVMVGLAANSAIVSADDLTKSPGLTLTFRGLEADAAFVQDGALKSGSTQHGDGAFIQSKALIPGDFFSPLIVAGALSVSEAEAAAKSFAESLFGTSYTDAQLSVARGYVVSGVLKPTELPEVINTTSALGKPVTNLREKLSPGDVFALWRSQVCEKSLALGD